MLDVEKIRRDFPILSKTLEGKPLVYLDNAATTHKPESVIRALDNFYRQDNSNIHRSTHGLANKATEDYERTRRHVARFIGAACAQEIVFTRNATESINLVARSWAAENLKAGDEILVTEMEHHANVVPWQMLAREKGLKLKVLPFDDQGLLKMDELDSLLTEKVKLFAFTWVSNVLGTVNPVEELVRRAKARGAAVLVDAAQAAPHLGVDVRKLGCDFLAFSAHKMLGPTGVGVLWGREELLDAMPPYQGGGSMIEDVRLPEGTTWNLAPWKFEAGTPDIAGVACFDAALDYLEALGMDEVHRREAELTALALDRLQRVEGFRLYGTRDPSRRGAVISFNLEGANASDLGQLLDSMGVAVRTGKLCAHPIMRHYGVEGMARASFYFYNTGEEVERFVQDLQRCRKILGVPAVKA